LSNSASTRISQVGYDAWADRLAFGTDAPTWETAAAGQDLGTGSALGRPGPLALFFLKSVESLIDAKARNFAPLSTLKEAKMLLEEPAI
jgi:hypothetical protein